MHKLRRPFGFFAAALLAAIPVVRLPAAAPLPVIRSSTLEVISLPSLDRRVVRRAAGKMEAPHFSPDGARFYGANGCFNVPCWSRDSTRLAFASCARE